MFEESWETEGCANNFSTPSPDFFVDSPDLYEKNTLQHQDTLLRSSVLADCDSGMPACREASWVHPSEDEASEVGGGLVLDGADDLEALMGCLDEEDDIHLAPTLVPGVESPYDLTSKRKRTCKELEDEEEVESKLCKRRKSEEADAFHELSSPDVSINGTGSGVTQPPCDDHKFEDEFCLDQSTEELQTLCDDFGFEMPEQQCSSCSPGRGDSISSGSAKQSRRQKIKETVKMLREAIPGGECFDAAIVLDETINYVKLLQLQVQALGAQRLAQRAGR